MYHHAQQGLAPYQGSLYSCLSLGYSLPSISSSTFSLTYVYVRLEDKPQDSVLSYHVGEMLLGGTPPAEHNTALGSVSRATHTES